MVVGGEQQWECFCCGDSFTGGELTTFQRCSQPPGKQLVPLPLPVLEVWYRCVFAAKLGYAVWKLFHLSN